MPGDQPPDGSQPEAGVHSASQAARPLGRGLEEVSHLFLSRVASSDDGSPASGLGLAPPVRPASRAGVAVLRPAAPLAREQLTATLRECQTALEDGMRAIGSGVSCGSSSEIDLLGLDRSHGIVIIDVETTPSDALLLRGIGHIDWVVGNLAIVRRMCQGWAIDSSRQPRLFLVAPEFSGLLRTATRQITQPAISCFRYRAMEIAGGTGIFVERVGHDDQ